MRLLLSMIGIPDLPTMHMVVLVLLAIAGAIMLGWLADSILGDGGFGLFANGVVLLAGAVIGAIIWRKLGYSVSGVGQPAATALAAAGSAVLTLVLAGSIKRAI